MLLEAPSLTPLLRYRRQPGLLVSRSSARCSPSALAPVGLRVPFLLPLPEFPRRWPTRRRPAFPRGRVVARGLVGMPLMLFFPGQVWALVWTRPFSGAALGEGCAEEPGPGARRGHPAALAEGF